METFLSIVPTILTVGLAFVTKNVYFSLLIGLYTGCLILTQYSLLGAVDKVIDYITGVFASGGNITTMMAILLLGSMMRLLEKSGGVNGFVDFLTKSSHIINTKKKANLFSWLLGVIVFVSANMSSLIVGAVSKPINDRFKTSHEKFAFITHAGSCPVCVLLPLSSWGAYMISLLDGAGVPNASGVMLQSIPYSIYVILAVFAVPIMLIFGVDFGPMKKAELRAELYGQLDDPSNVSVDEGGTDEIREEKTASAWILVLPILSMIVVTVFGMYVTGDGNILNGAGMRSYLWGVLSSIFLGVVMIKAKNLLTFKEINHCIYKGFESMIPIIIILVYALALGAIVKELRTGELLAQAFVGVLSPILLPIIVFGIAMLISFSTGSSWGTWAVMMPLVVPMATAMDVNIALIAATIWSGGTFGDQSSPISDTTVVVSAATGCNIIDHIKTQLPYTLTFAIISSVAFLLMGMIL